jgi:hypothetical protein
MEGTIAQRDASLQKKEERIKELKLSVALLQQELKLKAQSVDRLQASTAPPNHQVLQDTVQIKPDNSNSTSLAQGLDLGRYESMRDRKAPDLVSTKLQSLSMTGASAPSSQQQTKRPVLGDSNAVAVQGASSVDVLNI